MEKFSWVLFLVSFSCTCTDCGRSILGAQRRVEGSGVTFLQRFSGSGSLPDIHRLLMLTESWEREPQGCTGRKEVALLASLSEGLFCRH